MTFRCEHAAQSLDKCALAGPRRPREPNPKGENGAAQLPRPLGAVWRHKGYQVAALRCFFLVGGLDQRDGSGQAGALLLHETLKQPPRLRAHLWWMMMD